MTEQELQLLLDFDEFKISKEEFITRFGKHVYDCEFVERELSDAIRTENVERIELFLSLLWVQEDLSIFVNIFHELILSPHHRSHQVVAKEIQNIADPTSVVTIEKILNSDFSQFDYTCSEEGTIAKWFSWGLASIGTEQAFDVLKRFAKSGRPAIREEMQYRLKRIGGAS